MSALPNAQAPLFTGSGEPMPVLRQFLGGEIPRGALVDGEGRATPPFRNYLSGRVSQPLPAASVALADDQGRPTRAMTMMMMGLR